MARPLHILFSIICSLPLLAQEQSYFFIDERQPAQRNMLESSPRILIVNNAIQQPPTFGHTTIIDGTSQGETPIDLSLGILHCLFAATQIFETKLLFTSVQLMDVCQNTSNNFYSRKQLTYEQTQYLCNEYQVDAVLALNQLVLYDVLESFPTDQGNFYAYQQAYAQSHWSIHYAGQLRPIPFTQADTLLWESPLLYTRAKTLDHLPDRQDALIYLAQSLGERVASSFAPSWHTTRRYIYIMDELQDGIGAFRLQRWGEAIQLWKPCLSSNNKKAAAAAAANMAIASEMMGDFASACAYALQAVRLFGAWKSAYARQQQVNLRYYLELLQAREAVLDAQ